MYFSFHSGKATVISFSFCLFLCFFDPDQPESRGKELDKA